MKLEKLVVLVTGAILIVGCSEDDQPLQDVASSIELSSTSTSGGAAPIGQVKNADLLVPSNDLADVPLQIFVEGQAYTISPSSSEDAKNFIQNLVDGIVDPTLAYRLPIVIQYVLSREACTGNCVGGGEVFKVIVLSAGLAID